VLRQHVERLVEQRVPLVEVDTERVELGLVVPGSRAEDEPAAGQDVHRRRRLGQ
jgi:hypothetical protein